MGTVYRIGKQPVQVKNLGWLLRHASEVRKIELFSHDNAHLVLDSGAGTIRYENGPQDYGAGYFIVAHLFDGTSYVSSYASKEVFTGWITRNRNMKHVRVLNQAHFFDTSVIQPGSEYMLRQVPCVSPLVYGTRRSWR